MNLLGFINENKKAILTKVLIGVGVVAGLAIGAHLLRTPEENVETAEVPVDGTDETVRSPE